MAGMVVDYFRSYKRPLRKASIPLRSLIRKNGGTTVEIECSLESFMFDAILQFLLSPGGQNNSNFNFTQVLRVIGHLKQIRTICKSQRL